MTGHRIDLPWSRLPLSMNDRGHWAPRARKIRQVRDTACWLTRAAHLGRCSRVRVELHYQPAVRRGRDSDNLATLFKVCVDGACIDSGLVPDDTDRYVERVWPTIHPVVRGEPGRLWMVVTVLDPSEVA